MSVLKKVRVEIVNKENSEKEEVDILTSADCVKFNDDETFQDKLDNGTLRGQRGEKGEQGIPGEKGDKGDPGDGIKVGTTYEEATEKGIFFKIVE